jgi:hypothetical protein
MKTPTLGILMLDTVFPRIPGDIGNELSYDFPIQMKTVKRATVQRVVFDADPTLLDGFIAAACELEAEGVSAITSSCGFLSPLQEKVAQSVQVPVFLSSLIQVPLAHMMTSGRVAILTANSDSLTDFVLQNAGIAPHIPLAIVGLQDVAAFRDPILQGGTELQEELIEAEILTIVEDLLHEYPDIASFVFECHNLAPYSHAVQIKTEKPVFDIIDFARWVYSSIKKGQFSR